MPGNLIPIYAAQNSAEAHLLKNLLAESGVDALIDIENLQSGTGFMGWPTLPRVLVDRRDAVAATEIARRFDKREPIAAGLYDEFPWPSCPACSTRLNVVCPHCGEMADQFPLAIGAVTAASAGEEPSADRLRFRCPACQETFPPHFIPRCPRCGGDCPTGSAHENADREKVEGGEPEKSPQNSPLLLSLGTLLAVAVMAALLMKFVTWLIRSP